MSKIQTVCDFCGKTLIKIRSTIRNNNFCNNKCRGIWLSKNRKGKNNPNFGKHFKWTQLKLDFLKNNYLIMDNNDLSKCLNKTPKQIIEKLYILGLKRSLTWRKEIGLFKGKKNPMYGKKGKCNSFYGKHHTEKTKEKIRQSKYHKNLKGKNNPMYGKTHSKIIKEKQRQRRLKQVFPFKDSKIEIAMQNELKRRGSIFEIHKPIIGQPDIFIKPNICVFCDGDFWHGYNWKELKQKLNDYWKNIIYKKMMKDKQVNKSLRSEGFIVLRFWEHQIKRDIENYVDQILFTKFSI